jgi:DNA-binding transcriptional ArsR family regulator
MDTDMTEKRVTVFSFFSIYRGLNSSLFFSINNIVKWTGRQPNRHANGINSKIIQVIECLRDGGYLTLSEELDNSSCIEATLNLSKISEECDNDRFAIIYLDELKKIMDYQNPNAKDVFLNNDVILLVFTYLRMKIYRRRNKLFLEEINVDNQNNRQLDIDTRRLRSPDAYDCYYYEIAEELGLTPRTVSKAVDVLNELGLIYSESLPRIKYENKWRTDHTVFCNTYKREGNCLLISGSQYYLMEIENKKRKLNIVDNRKKKGGS